MTAAEAKAWLSRGFWLRQEKEQIIRLRSETFDRLTNITQTLSDMPSGGTKDPHRYDALAELDVELAEKEAEIDRARLEIYNAVRKVKENRLRVVLIARYCECMSWPEIQAVMHYHERQVYRLHGKALEQIAPVIEQANKGAEKAQKRCH